LIPPYIFALLLTVAADAIGRHFWPMLYDGQTGDALLDGNFVRKGYSISAVIPALFLLPASLSKDFGSNGPLWSLAFETLFYAAYPLWLRLRLSQGIKAFVIVAILSPLVFQLSGYGYLFVVAGHYCLWIAGAGLAEAVCGMRQSKNLIGLFLVTIIGLLGIGLFARSSMKFLAIYLILGVGMVVMFGFIPKRWSNSAIFRVLELLGIRSYTIYICHFPLLTMLSAWMFYRYGSRPVGGWFALLGGVTVLLVTLVCFELCEAYFLHTRLRLAPQPMAAD